MEGTEERAGGAAVSDPRGVLRQGRAFLDFFWDIAKPEQEVRLAATENLLRHLREGKKDDELKYTLQRLVDGLGATREAARPGFSLALAQVLQTFEKIPLCSILKEIKEKHNLEKGKKKLVKNAAFGIFFGVMALFQSGRLVKDRKALLESIQLLQQLTNHKRHLRDLPRKTLIDITSEVPESVFEEVLFDVLQGDLSSAFTSPENLHLLLVGMQKFPGVLKPKKLKKLFGSPTVVNEENIPRLVELLKRAAKSEKEDKKLPSVVFDLLQVALKEGAFELFWNEVVENGLLEEKSETVSYMCYRLLGSALPVLSLEQLQVVLKGNVMLHCGEHMVTTQGFKFAAEVEGYIDKFLSDCDDPERQLAVMVGFSTLTHQGKPVLLSASRVVGHMQAVALQKYVDWLKDMFLRPDLDCCLDFSGNWQKQNQEHTDRTQHKIARLRRWIIHRLISITESAVRIEESLVMDIARFCFFHAFFVAKKKTSQIGEASVLPSEPLNEQDHTEIENYFFGLLQILNTLPVLGDTAKAAALREKHVRGVTADGKLWIFLLAEYANKLLSSERVKAVTPFTEEQRDVWERTLQSVKNLQKNEKKTGAAKVGAFQQLLLSMAIYLFKNQSETVDVLSDLLNCTERAFSKGAEKKKTDNSEPGWVEVMVEILLSLLAQPSLLLRRISKNVFVWICPNLTKRGLQLILDVFDPNQEENEESAVVVMEESNKKTKSAKDTDEDGSEDSSDEDDSDSGDEEMSEEVDDDFRSQLMNVLQAGKASVCFHCPPSYSDEELDDEAMMALDKNISALFAEQQKRIQAKKDEKDKMRKEKILRRDFKAKVLDLIDVFLMKQAENPLVFDIIEPLLRLIEQCMSSGSDKQEIDFLQKTACIFRNSLCRNRQYCRTVQALQEDVHALVQRLVKKACQHTDSAVALYYFSASLYLLRVLKGNTSSAVPPPQPEKQNDSRAKQACQLLNPGCLDVKRVTVTYREALNEFFSKRNSPLTCSMFHDLFRRFPV
ncbi:MBB1A protein, partial [Furnarius figulus]|nr:MBB1A protein [Furnarius figulus]